MIEITPEIRAVLDNVYGPIVQNFVPTTTPEGAAPKHIKEQWLGVNLPVRERNLGRTAVSYQDQLTGEVKKNEHPVSVVGMEAINALLEAGRREAAEYWGDFALDILTFRAHEGELRPLK